MEQLDLLWDLELHHDSLSFCQKSMFRLRNKFNFNEVEKKIEKAEDKVIYLRNKKEKMKLMLNKYNSKLKDYNFKINEIEKNLYDGNTTDIKQLEFLDIEKDKIKKMINEMEIEILEQMDEVDATDEELLLIEWELEEIKIENEEIQKEYSEQERLLSSKIIVEKKNILEIEQKIDKELLDKYYNIKKNKGSGIAEVKDGVCCGCNMLLPTIQLDRLHNDDKTTLCENCGRILKIGP